jgi:8-oxo-dGTP pyrophosphatase MutT (NUDIX family)
METARGPGRSALLKALREYEPFDEREAEMRERFMWFTAMHADCFERTLAEGHVTGSAWVVDPDFGHTLLHRHRKLDRWLQPGGHADGDSDVLRVALREAQEETGLRSLTPAAGGIYDLDIHVIPARKSEAEHFHYDVRFAFTADRAEQLVCSSESLDLRWITLRDLESYAIDDSVRRLAAKTAALSRRLDG